MHCDLFGLSCKNQTVFSATSKLPYSFEMQKERLKKLLAEKSSVYSGFATLTENNSVFSKSPTQFSQVSHKLMIFVIFL